MKRHLFKLPNIAARFLEEKTRHRHGFERIAPIFVILLGSAMQMPDEKTARMENIEPSDSNKSSKLCGSWCWQNRSSNCQVDTKHVPCEGVRCTTSCDLWARFVLETKRKITCEEYKFGSAYVKGAAVCDESCLLPEIRKARYPQPTGVGLLCVPGTCIPAAFLGELEKPCNWFASNCTDDFVPVQRVIKGKTFGNTQEVKFIVPETDWQEIVKRYQPGGVIRITQYDIKGIPRDAAAALILDETTKPGELDVLLGPPDCKIHPDIRMVAERVRAMPTTSDKISNLYVTPAIGNFFNRSYMELADYFGNEKCKPIQNVIVVSSGAAIGAALSIVDAAPEDSTVHMYYGIRRIEELPYRERLEALVKSGSLKLTIIESQPDKNSVSPTGAIDEAVQRGEAVKRISPDVTLGPLLSLSPKIYAQHALGLELQGGELKKLGATMENSIVVICGRSELLLESEKILNEIAQEDTGFLQERVFTNV